MKEVIFPFNLTSFCVCVCLDSIRYLVFIELVAGLFEFLGS